MAKKVIKKMQQGGMVSPNPVRVTKTTKVDEKFGENTKRKLTPPKSTPDSTTKKPSKPAPAGMERYMEKGDNGKVYKKGGSVKKKK